VKMNVCGRGFVLDCDFVAGAKCRDKRFGSVHLT
jgi:hypothetical protein